MVVARREQSEIVNLHVCHNSREARSRMTISPRIESMVDGRWTRLVPDAASDIVRDKVHGRRSSSVTDEGAGWRGGRPLTDRGKNRSDAVSPAALTSPRRRGPITTGPAHDTKPVAPSFRKTSSCDYRSRLALRAPGTTADHRVRRGAVLSANAVLPSQIGRGPAPKIVAERRPKAPAAGPPSLWKTSTFGRMVGVAGFEPATPASRTQCSTGLSHTPTRRRLIASGLAHRKRPS